MKVITPEMLAATAAKRWREQYKGSGHSFAPSVLAKLKALGDKPSPAQVNEAIGNDTWTVPPSCSECNGRARTVVQLGQESDYASSTVWLCVVCVSKAFTVITGGKA